MTVKFIRNHFCHTWEDIPIGDSPKVPSWSLGDRVKAALWESSQPEKFVLRMLRCRNACLGCSQSFAETTSGSNMAKKEVWAVGSKLWVAVVGAGSVPVECTVHYAPLSVLYVLLLFLFMFLFWFFLKVSGRGIAYTMTICLFQVPLANSFCFFTLAYLLTTVASVECLFQVFTEQVYWIYHAYPLIPESRFI